MRRLQLLQSGSWLRYPDRAPGANWLCLRNPFGAGWNSSRNSGCGTVLSGSQGAQLIGATIVVAVGTVGTFGLSDLLIGAADRELALGTFEGSLNATHLLISGQFILGVPFGIGLAGAVWGYNTIVSRSEGC